MKDTAAGGGMRRPKRIRSAASLRGFVAGTYKQITAILTGYALLACPASAAAEWRHARGSSANTSFATVDTQPARVPMNVYSLIGPIAPGVNPVVGPDGTVYIGNMEGELQFRVPDGWNKFSRWLNPEHGGIYSSPVVGSDGSIYVVSTKYQADSPDRVNQSFMHKFTPGGAWVYSQPFPRTALAPATDGGGRGIDRPSSGLLHSCLCLHDDHATTASSQQAHKVW
jgi:hypothetical protein